MEKCDFLILYRNLGMMKTGIPVINWIYFKILGKIALVNSIRIHHVWKLGWIVCVNICMYIYMIVDTGECLLDSWDTFKYFYVKLSTFQLQLFFCSCNLMTLWITRQKVNNKAVCSSELLTRFLYSSLSRKPRRHIYSTHYRIHG